MRKQNVLLVTLSFYSIFILSYSSMAQVAINTDGSVANASAILDIKNTGKGVLIPRMTQSQRDAITSPADGLMIYQTNVSPGFYYNAGTAVSPVWQAVGGQSKSATQIALLQWYQPIATYITSSTPRGIAFDGKYMWITNGPYSGPYNVRRYDASGTVVGSSNPGFNPTAIAFDGINMWIVNQSGPTGGVTKINAATGVFVASYSVPDASSIVFDGTSVWLTQPAYVSVTKIDVNTGVTDTYPAGNYPNSIAFDGSNLWVTNANTYVTKINGITGGVISNYEVGGGNWSSAFDGINMWISVGTDTVKKLNLSGAIVGAYAVNYPSSKAFDGTDMWILNMTYNTVTRMNIAGNIVATYPVGNSPLSLAFDGTSMWIVNGDNTVTKIHK